MSFMPTNSDRGAAPIFFGPCTPHGTPGQVGRTWGTRPIPSGLCYTECTRSSALDLAAFRGAVAVESIAWICHCQLMQQIATVSVVLVAQGSDCQQELGEGL